MKRKILLPVALIFTALLVLLGINYWLSLHTTTFTLDNTVSSIKVYSSNNQEVGSLSNTGSLHLKSGDYYIIPNGNNISTDKIKFAVKNEDLTVTIRPPFAKEYLKELLEKDSIKIEEAIADKYPSLYPNYILTNHTLYERGEWFGGLLTAKVSDLRNQRDPYRIILHKEGGTWKVIRRPEYILTSSRYSEVPVEVLRDINQQVQRQDIPPSEQSRS